MKEEQQEEWRAVVGYEGLYEVSNLGRVRNAQKKNIIKTYAGPYGRQDVSLSRNGRSMARKIHRLVAFAFIGPPPTATHQVAHYDGNAKNNRPENLRWATPKENNDDRFRHGTVLSGEDHPMAILTLAQVLEIRERLSRGERCSSLSVLFGVTYSTVHLIKTGKNWRMPNARRNN